MATRKKSFPVFDCDAHINDPVQIWDYVPDSMQERVKNAYYRTEQECWLNGEEKVIGGGSGEFAPLYNPICIAGPGMNKKIMRRLISMMPLSEEVRKYVFHEGAVDPYERVRDLDLAGIDQVLVIPTMVLMNVPFIRDLEAADAFCRAYNDFAQDWCTTVPDRLFGAGLLPFTSPEHTVREVQRLADEKDHMPVALIRPIDAQGRYPNDLGQAMAQGDDTNWDTVFRTFEETGMVLGMHTFPAPGNPHPLGENYLNSPGQLLTMAGADSQTFSFIFEAQTWLAQVLLSGLLDRYPKLKMAIYESNSQWIPPFLAHCDRLAKLYASERSPMVRLERLPSEAFFDQCVISFESDEEPTIRQWKTFQDTAIWASDMYHHDGADAWSAMDLMDEAGVPDDVQAKMLGTNACRFYGIEPQVFVTEEHELPERPDWFPQGEELERWAEIVAEPRKHMDELRELGLDPFSFIARQQAARAGAESSE